MQVLLDTHCWLWATSDTHYTLTGRVGARSPRTFQIGLPLILWVVPQSAR